jgi:hypothetical protein
VSFRWINGNTAVNLGTVTPTVTAVTGANYDVTWTGAHPNGSNYAIFAMTRFNGVAHYTESMRTATGLRVTTHNLSGVPTATDFNLMTYP